MRLAVVQVREVPAEVPPRAAPCLRTLQTCAEAGADLALFPELYLGGYVLDQRLTLKAEQAEQALGRRQAAVEELGLSAVLGLPLRHGAALLNGVAVLCPGAPARFYGKTHLFQAETEWFAPGHDLWQDEIAGWPCGLVVCYELGFPEVARALENGCYLAAANHAGAGAHGEFLGASRIVDPRGSVAAAAGSGDEVVCADLDAAEVDNARGGDDGGHTYFADRRPELYGEISRPVEQHRRAAS